MAAPLAAADVAVSFDGLRALSNVALEVSRGRATGAIGREVFTSLTADENLRARGEGPAGARSGGQCNRGRVGDAFHASLNHNSQIGDSGRQSRNEGLRAMRACRPIDAKSAIEGGSP